MSPSHPAPQPYRVEPGHRAWQVHTSDHLTHDALAAALATVEAGGGEQVYVWVSEPTAGDDGVARAHGMALGRDLYQLRVPLPLADPAWRDELETRPFRPGLDDAAWLEVNNRAFAWHPEQGGWTAETLQERLAEPWFDAEGFLLHDRDARLAGFCWTKVHAAPERLGEIFVIAVDPDFAGLGLGRALTVAGLRWLHDERAVDTGMLYVDASNTPAVTLYDRLGFNRHHTDRAYFRELTPR
jgi:mycothiol synthase